MESSSVNGLCRCCASQGAFKDIKTSYHWMGEEEVYSDMLRECFDVSLTSVDRGGICELCITQLRNASNFKKQVVQTEAQFKQHLRSKGFKPVKEEMSGFDDNDSDDNDMDNGDDEDYVPDYEVPIKTESESEDKPKKRGSKTPSTRAKKSKSTDGDAAVKSIHRPNAEEYSMKLKGSTSLYDDDQSDEDELQKQLQNLKEILLSTNATPIRRFTDRGYMCCYCDKQYMKPIDLKIHTLMQHDDKTKETLMAKENINNFLVKLDITLLECNICNERVDDLYKLAVHLIDHGKLIRTDIKTYILPFKFVDDSLKCVICKNEFINFKSLQIHMYAHFANYECNICGTGFVNRKMVNAHYRNTHRKEPYVCSYCPLVFETIFRKKNHEIEAHHAQKLYKCSFCDKRFNTFDHKRVHLKKVHDLQKRLLECKSCGKTFWKPSLLSIHVKKVHLMEKNFKCMLCDRAYFFEYELNDHLVTHTNVKEYKCEICYKYYARKKSLREHVKIHANDRKHRCAYCTAAFVQKVTLKKHLISKHGIVE